MKLFLLKHWDIVRSSFWFVPALMTTGAAMAAYAAVALDTAVTDEWLQAQPWAYTGGAEGASSVLSTIAGSMITIAGVVFSMTLVALSLATSQLGPRLLRNFMRDAVNQTVLGTFIATFVYCLMVLRSVRRADEELFVPHLAVTLGVLLALVSLGVLIYFIHHVSISIQADEVIARTAVELNETIDRLFPDDIGKPAEKVPEAATMLPGDFDRDAAAVPAPRDGYLQRIDGEALLELARSEDLVLRIERRPGQYVTERRPLATVFPGARIDRALGERIVAAFVIGRQRTSAQDVEFVVEQLVEIAVRALSPGINDPFTAIACVDRLASALHRLARKEMPAPARFDDGGRLRVVAPADTFAGIVDTAFDQLRQNARSSAAVTIRLLDAIAVVATAAQAADRRDALRRQAELIARGARELSERADRRIVEARHAEALGLLQPGGDV